MGGRLMYIADADGADQIFAQAIVQSGGRLEVVVPAVRYRDGLPPEHHRVYDDLLGRASHIERLDHVQSTSNPTWMRVEPCSTGPID